ncbi:MAG TPA: alpha/beta fold hydrolase [Usitatibacter sp.]|nr:alpha/beta fold hydrolase [Usitatibacter sp.]
MIRLIAALVLAAACTAVRAAGAIPIDALFRLPQYGAMVMAPDGKHIAALIPINGRQNIAVLDLATHKAQALTGLTDFDVVYLRWINSHRLAFQTGTLSVTAFDSRGSGLYTIGIDGQGMRRIGASAGYILRTLPDESEEFIGIVSDSNGSTRPLRVDSRTGRRTPIETDKPETGKGEGWIVDRQGVPRVFVESLVGEKRKVYYRDGEGSPWVMLEEFASGDAEKWVPVAIADGQHAIYVASWIGRDKAAIVRYDTATRKMGEVLAQHPRVDIGSIVTDHDGALLGVRYLDDKTGAAWTDENFARVQVGIDKALPDTVNWLTASLDQARFLIYSWSDVKPMSFYLFDPKSGKLEWLADSRPWLDPKSLSPMTPVRYAARDGLEIPAYLTIPRGSTGKNLPMVVMVHGGPWVTGDAWGFNPEVQFLASRGYAVLQPNYRGTTRYGWKHFSSSFHQWGLAMQDDITDGVKWAIAQGVADPKRICIYGASYGGYAAMMGLAKTPELFKCGVDYVGVTDLKLFATATWADFSFATNLDYGMKTLMGDITQEPERLAATSPVEQANRIKAPVLMAYGSSDSRVVPEHGLRMKAALESAGNAPQWIFAEGEGHGFRDPKNRAAFYGAMEKFLEANIGPGQDKETAR